MGMTETTLPRVGQRVQTPEGKIYRVIKRRELKSGTKLTMSRYTKAFHEENETHPLQALPKGWKVLDEEGQTMAEYLVVLSVIALAVIATMVALSGGISEAIEGLKGLL